jgi:aerobic-type carbon monoxide dehydrogenase small subunit (CoxS/CutS family)
VDTTFSLLVNGEARTVTTDPERPLLDVLREDLGLTGTKYGCGEGQCCACSVLIEGKRVRSCITPVSKAETKPIITIEGLGSKDSLHPVQEAFLSTSAFQCGYCTPGMILSAVALLDKNPHPSDEEIVAGMNPNLCRCCGYPKVVAAVREAARKMAGRSTP